MIHRDTGCSPNERKLAQKFTAKRMGRPLPQAELSREQVARLDAASDAPAAYPVWHGRGFPMLGEQAAMEIR